MLQLERDGAEYLGEALSPNEVQAILSALEPLDRGRAGTRLSHLAGFQGFLGADGIVGQIVCHWLGPRSKPVRAVLFDKNAYANWALGWHQDRTIAVYRRVNIPGFNNWNRKDGIDHVEPPFELIERMLTVRIHLDSVSADNAPLLISPGSHRLGRLIEGKLGEVVERHGAYECLANAGDIWVYRTAIVHASKPAVSPSRRRVLQVDYSSEELPAPLQWQAAL